MQKLGRNLGLDYCVMYYYMVPINSNKFLIPDSGVGGEDEDDDGVAPARSGQIPRVHAGCSAVLSVDGQMD